MVITQIVALAPKHAGALWVIGSGTRRAWGRVAAGAWWPEITNRIQQIIYMLWFFWRKGPSIAYWPKSTGGRGDAEGY